MRRSRRLLLLEVAAAATPLAVLLLLRSDPSPSQASAGTLPVPTSAAPAPWSTKPPTPEQARALAWLKGLEPPEALRSPLDHASTRPKAIAIEARKPAPAAVDPLDGVTLSGVIGTGEGGMASIDGVLFKVGEEIRPGVTLVAVEPRQSSVVVRLSDGTERRLQRADRPRTPTHRH